MRVQALLTKADNCSTDEEAKQLGFTLEKAFRITKALSGKQTYNPEAYMEGDYPHVYVEFNQEISNHYITTIRPEIRDEKLTVRVSTQLMLDGLGIASCSWETVDGLEEVLEPLPGETVASMAKRAKAVALGFHADLLGRVGLKEAQAVRTARSSW